MPKIVTIAETLLLEKLVEGLTRRARAGFGLNVLSGFLALVGGGFLIVAFHEWAQTRYPADVAALMTAGTVFGAAALVALGALYVAHRRRLRLNALRREISHGLHTAVETLDEELGDQVRENPAAAVLLAGLAGYFVADKVLQ